MAEEPDSLLLVYLRRLCTRMDRVIEDLRDPKVRMTAVEEGLSVVRRRIDRLEDPMGRVEKRLHLVEPSR